MYFFTFNFTPLLFHKQLTKGAAEVHPVWRTMAILLLLVTLLLAVACVALCIITCRRKKGVKSQQISQSIKQEGVAMHLLINRARRSVQLLIHSKSQLNTYKNVKVCECLYMYICTYIHVSIRTVHIYIHTLIYITNTFELVTCNGVHNCV